MTPGYNEIYLDDAMDTLGGAVEYAVFAAGMNGRKFIELFISTELADEFARGNAKYVSGMSGIELCRLILERCGLDLPAQTTLPHTDYPSAYWIGWILAYYQWLSGRSFSGICRKIPYETLDQLYSVLHEADPSKAADVLEKIMTAPGETNLARLRKSKSLSQSELAKASGISVRSVQLYEQRQNDINHGTYQNLKNMAQVLGCRVEDLVE